MSTAYPAELPLKEISDVISMLTGATPPSAKIVAKSAWITTGYVLNVAVGEPATNEQEAGHSRFGLGALSYNSYSVRALSNEEAAALLQAIVALENKDTGEAFKAAGIISDVLGSEFLRQQLAKLVLPFLLSKLREWIENGGLEDIVDSVFTGRAVGKSTSCCKA